LVELLSSATAITYTDPGFPCWTCWLPARINQWLLGFDLCYAFYNKALSLHPGHSRRKKDAGWSGIPGVPASDVQSKVAFQGHSAQLNWGGICVRFVRLTSECEPALCRFKLCFQGARLCKAWCVLSLDCGPTEPVFARVQRVSVLSRLVVELHFVQARLHVDSGFLQKNKGYQPLYFVAC
jgi:hypothetical protein